jgi:serine/threonine protein kinase
VTQGIESLRYIYSDINTENILFNNEDQLKLVDFDHAIKARNDLKVNNTLYVRA